MENISYHHYDSALCPNCGSDLAAPCFHGAEVNDFVIVRCRSCGLVYANPRPTTKQIKELYSYNYFNKKAGPLGYDDYESLPEINAKLMWPVVKKYARGALPANGSIMDIGCATGAFLAEASADGWDSIGIETSDHAAEIARTRFGIRVYTKALIPEELHGKQFDVVTMFHIIEHLIEPLNVLRKAGEMVKAGGFLLVETPNWDSFGRVIRGMRWEQLKPPEHINYFTPRTLSKMVESAGFKIVRCTTEYPSFIDKARISRFSQPIHLMLALFALIGCCVGRGGYVRILAQKT